MKNTIILLFVLFLASCKCKEDCKIESTLLTEFNNLASTNTIQFKNSTGNIISFSKIDSSATTPYKTSGKSSGYGTCSLDPDCELENNFIYSSNILISNKQNLKYSLFKNVSNQREINPYQFIIELFDFKRTIEFNYNSFVEVTNRDSILYNYNLGLNTYDTLYLYKPNYAPSTRIKEIIFYKSSGIVAFKDSLDGTMYIKQ